jgi:hypothetical protein
MPVLFLLFGSSGVGKTAVVGAVRARKPSRLAVHEFDELHVPVGADTAWRQRANEAWVRRALAYQARGLDLLLAGQTPFGELLATPSAPHLAGISACLLDCDETTQRARLRKRGDGWRAPTGGTVQDYVNWAAWMRQHAADPRARPEVITSGAAPGQRWERWSDWATGDPRWRVRVIDSTVATIEEIADTVLDWVEEERAASAVRPS